MATTTKRINRRKLAVIQAYTIIALFVLFGLIAGFIVGRFTASPEVETVTETVEVPTYNPEQLPEVGEITYYNVPLSHSLQRFIYEVCADENVPVALVMAMIDHESHFNPEIVSNTDDYGLMQINAINHEQLEEQYRAADMLDPYQNVFCGIKVISSYIEKYEDYSYALMAYNMGEYGAKKSWESGTTSTLYSDTILELMSEYEQEVKENAASSGNE
jgi:soluble lytic murein transglycosylase-like protein|nr:MAG TPA: Transglycosylase SLT domain [Caudoviricetes sp.]